MSCISRGGASLVVLCSHQTWTQRQLLNFLHTDFSQAKPGIQTTDFQPSFSNSSATASFLWGLSSISDLWLNLVRVPWAHKGHIYSSSLREKQCSWEKYLSESVTEGKYRFRQTGCVQSHRTISRQLWRFRLPHYHDDLVLGVCHSRKIHRSTLCPC